LCVRLSAREGELPRRVRGAPWWREGGQGGGAAAGCHLDDDVEGQPLEAGGGLVGRGRDQPPGIADQPQVQPVRLAEVRLVVDVQEVGLPRRVELQVQQVDFITRTSHYESFTVGGAGCNAAAAQDLVAEAQHLRHQQRHRVPRGHEVPPAALHRRRRHQAGLGHRPPQPPPEGGEVQPGRGAGLSLRI
jgi:hypothetical protein